MKKCIIFLLIIALMSTGVYRLTINNIYSDLEGILLFISSYLFLFTCSKIGLLPDRLNELVKWLTDTSDND